MGKTSKKGKIEYFEPNELYGGDNHSVKLEDLSKYINLYVKVPSRYLKTTEYDGVMGGTLYTITNNNKTTQIPLLTTNYVDVSYTEIKKGNIINGELFGIESININFDVQFFPRVTINFTDVRGFGLMSEMQKGTSSTSETNKRDLTAKSFFTSLFNFPYPTFTLEVKGYYGNRVSFDLALEEFNTEFDSLTGNFRTTVTFIGSLWGILADIPMSYLMIAPFIDRGDKNTNDYWNAVNLDNSSLTYIEFLDKYNELLSGKDFNDTENKSREKLKNLYENQDEKEILKEIKIKYEHLIDEVKKGWEYANTVFSKTENYKEYDKTFDYDEFNKWIDNKPYRSTSIIGVISKFNSKSERMDAIYVYDAYKDLKEFLNKNKSYKSTWDIDYINSGVDNGGGNYFAFLNETYNYNHTVKIKGNVHIYNFIDLKSKIDEITKKIEDINIDENEFDVSLLNYVSEKLGSKPTINVVYDTLFKHLECFSNIFNDAIKNCRYQSLSLKDIGSDYITDIPTSDKHKDLSCPPFPLIAEKKDEKVEIIYPGNINLFKDRYEVRLTENIYNAIVGYVNSVTEAQKKIEKNITINETKKNIDNPNFIVDLLAPKEMKRNYEAIWGYENNVKVDLIKDIFLSRLVSYGRLHGYYKTEGLSVVADTDQLKMFVNREVSLLYSSNENLFLFDDGVLRGLEQTIDYYGRYDYFYKIKDKSFINYYKDAEKSDENNCYVVHKNNNESSCKVLASGVTSDIYSTFNQYSNSDFFVNIEEDENLYSGYKEYNYYYYTGSKALDGSHLVNRANNNKNYYLANGYSEGGPERIYFEKSKANYLFDIYDFCVFNHQTETSVNQTSAGSFKTCNTYCSSMVDRNKILHLNIDQVLSIGEYIHYYLEIKKDETTKHRKLILPEGHTDNYVIDTILNNGFVNFCLNEYRTFIETKNYDKDKKYIIAKSWATEGNELEQKILNNVWFDFKTKIREKYGLSESSSVSSISESYDTIDKSRNELKLNIYYTLKTLFDKWYCGLNESFFNANVMSNTMKYYNTLLKDIKNDLLFDVEKYVNRILSFAEGEKALDTISFMSQVAQDNNCNFISLPQYPEVAMEEIFKPQTLYNKPNNFNRGSTYMLVHNGDASHFLDDEESDYVNDGFSIADYDSEINDEFLKQSEIKAFGVTYGMQNQNLFRNISINTKNPTITDYSIANTLLIAGSTGKVNNASSASINAQSLFPVYANRSYECIVEMMGCMDIKPLMYFQLNNVPLFRGAYMITNVSHHITPNDFVTTFNGTRVSKYQIPINGVRILRSSYINLGKNLLDEGSNSKKGNPLSSYYTYTKNNSEGGLTNNLFIDKITLHGDAYENQLENHTIVIHKDHIENRGFKGIGYHFWISKDGEIYNGRPINKVGSHVKNKNTGNIGICFFSGSKDGQAPNIEQQKSAAALIRVLFDLFGLKEENVYGHRELQGNKACPNFDVGKCIREDGDENWYKKLIGDTTNFSVTNESSEFTDYIKEYSRLGYNNNILVNDNIYVKYVNSKFKKIYYVWGN